MFLAPACSWCIAQGLKVIIYTFLTRSFRPERLVGGGGMPSSHSATVCALVVAAAACYGPDGFEFPMAFFFAFIVMYDAMGVRWETGEQAKVINAMMEQFKDIQHVLDRDHLKEFIGHTPLQVFVGAVIGIVTGLAVCSLCSALPF